MAAKVYQLSKVGKGNCDQIRKIVNDNLKKVLEDYGVKLEVSFITYNHTGLEFTMKLDGAIASSEAKAHLREIKNNSLSMYGLKIGSALVHKGKKYHVTDYNGASRARPIIATGTDGKTSNWPASLARQSYIGHEITVID